VGVSLERTADRAGVSVAYVTRLAELGLIGDDGEFGEGDVRRVQIIEALERAGMSVDNVGLLVRRGMFSLAFIDAAGNHVFAALGDATFAEVSDRTGVPIEVLMTVREAVGGRTPTPDDRVREDELAIVPLLAMQHELGFRPPAMERALRVYGDSLRRIAETEAEWWRSEIQERMIADGATEDEVGRLAGEISPRLSAVSDEAIIAMYHAQQRLAWSVNIVNGIARAMEEAGLHTRDARPPAMCFLDITGYTQLTQERGDSATAALVERMNRIVQRVAVEHDGRPVKWLGDGVMLYFPDPARAVDAALVILRSLGVEDLPPAHVGLHAGPVVFQEGDFYGQTVNVAARIGEYARPGEVLVSSELVEVAVGADASFDEIGAVELKGVSGAVRLFSVRPRTIAD
jgi:adenylate cyclase